jgi:hypothetical protein
VKLADFILSLIEEQVSSADRIYKEIDASLSDDQFITMDRVNEVLETLESTGKIHLAKGMWNLGPKPEELETGINSKGDKEVVLTPESRKRWKDFRRLLAYYTECVRYDEKASYKLYGDQLNKQWLPIAMYRDWFDTPKDETLEIPLSVSHSKFVLNVLSQRAEQLFVSYPLEVVKTPQYHFVVPIFCIPVSTLKLEGQNLKLGLDFESIDANSDWLEHSCPNKAARENFLKISGLRDPGGVDLEDEIGGEESTTDLSETLSFDIDRLINTLKTFHGEKLGDRHLEPGSIEPLPSTSSLPPGIHNGMVLFSGKKLKYTASLVRELRRLQNHAKDEEFENSALKHLFFPNQSVQNEYKGASVFPVLDLTQSQFQAACYSSTEDLSVVTGPPGTGKSQVVSVALASALLRGETAVFASKNHRALDAVTPRLNSLSESIPVIRRQKEMEVSEHSWKKVIDEILSNPVTDLATWEELDNRKKYCRRLSEDLAEIIEEYENILNRGKDNSSAFWKRREITSRRDYTNINFDYLVEKRMEKTLNRFSKEMRDASAASTHHFSIWEFWKKFFQERREKKVKLQVEKVSSKINLPTGFFSTDVKKFKRNAEKADLLADDIISLRELPEQADQVDSNQLSELRTKCKEVIQELKTISIETLRMHLKVSLSTYDDNERETLNSAKVSIKQLENATSDQEMGRLSDQLAWAFKTLLSKTPLLAVTNLSAMKMFPSAQPAQFEMLVIDEASQSDIPSTIPLLFRSKRVCVIGDPKQLKAVHPMKGSMHEHIKKKLGLNSPRFAPYDYLESSFFDLASNFATDKRRSRLVEHFRCHPQIAGYCNLQ